MTSVCPRRTMRPFRPRSGRIARRRTHGAVLAVALAVAALGCAPTTTTSGTPRLSTDDHPAAQRWLGRPIVFATAAQGAALLGTEDDFTRALSPMDRSLRLGTPAEVTPKQHLDRVRAAAVDWNETELAAWQPSVEAVGKALAGMSLPLPSEIVLVRTDGTDEFSANYTRANFIVLPRTDRRTSRPESRIGLLAHELFHVASRHGARGFRDRMYPIVGFERVSPGPLPDDGFERRITNPDAYTLDHAVTVTVRGKGDKKVVPLLISRVPRSELKGAPNLARIMGLRLAPLDDGGRFQVNEGRFVTLGLDDTDYLRRTQLNTRYVIHPEEILADNFSLMVRRRAGFQRAARHPEILDALARAIRGAPRS